MDTEDRGVASHQLGEAGLMGALEAVVEMTAAHPDVLEHLSARDAQTADAIRLWLARQRP